MSATQALPAAASDGHRWELLYRRPAHAHANLLWLPALGVAARHYLPLAEALASRGIAVYLHEWRGHGSSTLRPSRQQDWGYQTLLGTDLPVSDALRRAHAPQLPLLLGGHSLGGQLACCHAALQPRDVAGLWLVASGSPYWRNFPLPLRLALPLVYRLLPWLARVQGVLHGRRLGFGGTEARGLVADWAQVGRSNRYRAAGSTWDLEAALSTLTAPINAVLLAQDPYAPVPPMQALAAKMPSASYRSVTLQAEQLGVPSDHFAWMRRPDAVAEALCDAKTPTQAAGQSSQKD
ncbi:alpha/beta hydrolase family protein [Xanthomonas maliensis]|uniref:alpha/beta hydrolase family protein n=1 Tax=Xanthomonas maliensis TaxID=1321368 RepID=UPI0003A561CF|nr:alpha/beta fold hydrolase [Xanthomonas maliensis]KAB7772419.1 hypothetical protein CKY51_00610 [Xanthomonas maliensis]